MTNELKGNIEHKQVLNGTLTSKKALCGGIKFGTSTGNYDVLINKPRINDVELRGNKTFEELGMIECSNQDIEDMFK